MQYVVFAAVAVVVFFAGTKYGKKLESDAFAELGKLKTALSKTGVKLETYLSGDVKKIKADVDAVIAKL